MLSYAYFCKHEIKFLCTLYIKVYIIKYNEVQKNSKNFS